MRALVAADAEDLAAGFTQSCSRMAEAAEAGRFDAALAELAVQAELRLALEPALAALMAADASQDGARHRVAVLLQQAHSAGRNAEAGLSRGRDELEQRLCTARSAAAAAAGYGSVDLPVSSGFLGRG